jgi:hypothetical protein
MTKPHEISWRGSWKRRIGSQDSKTAKSDAMYQEYLNESYNKDFANHWFSFTEGNQRLREIQCRDNNLRTCHLSISVTAA